MSGIPAARLVPGSTGFNTINVRTVDIFLQKSPGKPGDARGITGLHFEVVKDGATLQTGTTGADGKVQMRLPGGSATLRIAAGGVFAEYDVSIRDDAPEDIATLDGQKRRLRMLGYQIGHGGAEGVGVDGAATPDSAYDRCILEFQADKDLPTSSIGDAGTQAGLTGDAGI